MSDVFVVAHDETGGDIDGSLWDVFPETNPNMGQLIQESISGKPQLVVPDSLTSKIWRLRCKLRRSVFLSMKTNSTAAGLTNRTQKFALDLELWQLLGSC